ncbi:MAG TPA: transaldolase family protein, partial [Thermodesulfobacteriota bacterium]|nr:transaldolase family protein [Thermodesulfobacteriota bacterium]
PRPRPRVRVPLLAALRAAGTAHLYADTADPAELAGLLGAADGAIPEELDGNTVNQPLVRRVAARYLEAADPAAWARQLARPGGARPRGELLPLLYTLLCARIGHDFLRQFGHGRPWEVSLQLHMALGADPAAATRVARDLHRMVPQALVKVPFTPHAPHAFIVARDLEREGIPVNFTSTFSARQVAAAALLADVTRTNVFMGRINEGLAAELLGEEVTLAAQRTLLALRREAGVKTRLIVASLRDWRTFVRAAGCDVFTAPCPVLGQFLAQREVGPEAIASRLETSYDGELRLGAAAAERLGAERIARLYRVEPELLEFLRRYRASGEWAALRDGDRLARRFEEAGFGDLFYAPGAAEWAELRRGKLPDLASPLTGRLALDTLYSLLADADFEQAQGAIDQELARRAGL